MQIIQLLNQTNGVHAVFIDRETGHVYTEPAAFMAVVSSDDAPNAISPVLLNDDGTYEVCIQSHGYLGSAMPGDDALHVGDPSPTLRGKRKAWAEAKGIRELIVPGGGR